MQQLLKTRQESYLNWLAGADHDLIKEEINTLISFLFSPEADDIHSTAQTQLGAGA